MKLTKRQALVAIFAGLIGKSMDAQDTFEHERGATFSLMPTPPKLPFTVKLQAISTLTIDIEGHGQVAFTMAELYEALRQK